MILNGVVCEIVLCVLFIYLSAVGKSTFARLLQSANSDWEVVAEPVSKWQNIESGNSKVCSFSLHLYYLLKEKAANERQPLCSCLWQEQTTVSNLLQMMYQDPQRWSYTFQTYSCMSRLRTQLQPPPARLLSSEGTPVQVYERSVYSDRWVKWSEEVKIKIKSGQLRIYIF